MVVKEKEEEKKKEGEGEEKKDVYLCIYRANTLCFSVRQNAIVSCW